MTDLDDIYSDDILVLAAQMPRTARLEAPDASGTAHSKMCGSTVTVDVKLDGERVSDYGQEVKACLLGQGTAAVLGAHAVGATIDEIREAARQMRAMLREDGPVPAGKWSDLGQLQGVKHFKARHASTLLAFDAIEAAFRSVGR